MERLDGKPRRVFLSHPVTDWVSSNGEYRPEKKAFVKRVIETLESLSLEVECAAVNEDYGAIELQPPEFTAYDFEAIMRSDLFVLITTERLTRDMYLEAGMAFARGIPVYFIIPASARVTYMILGLEDMDRIAIRKYDSEEEVPGMLEKLVSLPTDKIYRES